MPFDEGSQDKSNEFPELESLQLELDKLRRRLANSTAPDCSETQTPEEATRLVREIVKSRRRREAFFAGDLFGEPAWDILLELFLAEQAQRRVSVSSACTFGAVPPTTGLRWIDRLEKDGWVSRQADLLDRRRFWLALTERGSTAMRNYLGSTTVRAA